MGENGEREELVKRQMATDLPSPGGGGAASGGKIGAAASDGKIAAAASDGKIGAAASDGKIAVVTVGKFQGPHFGHRILIQKVADTAAAVGGEPFVFTSTSKEFKYKPHFKIVEKLAIMRKMFGDIINPANIKEGSPRSLFVFGEIGYKTIYFLAGSDRLKTEIDCETEFGKDTKEFKECWNFSFLKSFIRGLRETGVVVKTIVAGEERGDETAEGAPSGKNFRDAAVAFVNNRSPPNKKRAFETLTTLMNTNSSVQFRRADIIKHAKSMVNNVGKPGKGGRRTKRRQKTQHRNRRKTTKKRRTKGTRTRRKRK